MPMKKNHEINGFLIIQHRFLFVAHRFGGQLKSIWHSRDLKRYFTIHTYTITYTNSIGHSIHSLPMAHGHYLFANEYNIEFDFLLQGYDNSLKDYTVNT